MKVKHNDILIRNSEILTTDIENEIGLMNIQKGYYYTLNMTGKDVWDYIDGQKSVGDIVGHLLEKYEIEKTRCQKEVSELIEIMYLNGLVKIQN